MALRFAPARGAGALSLSSYLRGPQGAAATIAVGTNTALAEGSTPTVTNSGSSSAAVFNFGIPRGVIPAVGFNFDTSTTDSDPGAGNVRFNNATPANVTTIYFDNLDRDGNTITGWLDSLDDSTSTAKGTLIVTPAASPSAKLVYAISGSVVDGTGYRKVTVAWVAGTVLPSLASQLAFEFSQTGNRGINVGFRQTYSSTTTDGDPGAGNFRLNNATIASATAAYLDNLDVGGTTVSGIIDLWDDATNAVKGSVRFVNQDDPTIWAEFQITGSVVDGTGYRKLTLQNGQSAGAFSGTFSVSFYRSGNAGDLLAANNLSDISQKYTGFDNLSVHGADIASAGTVNLETATGNLVDVTGTTTITAITLSEGHERTVRFTGALTLTNGASLVLPGGASITTAAGDYAVFRGYSAGVVRCVDYVRAATKPIAGSKGLTINADLTFAGTDSTTMTFPGISSNVGYLEIPQNSKSAAYTTVLADAGKHILHPTADNNARTFTIDSNANVAYPIGTTITFVNQINTVTISITTDTLTLAGAGSTGSRTLAANGIATALKVASTSWVISGTGLT
jgi:hypothetical protein